MLAAVLALAATATNRAEAQIIPSTTTTTEPEITTTTITPETSTTTTTVDTTTTTTAETTTSSSTSEAPARPTTTEVRPTTSTFVPPSGVPSTIAPPAEEVLDADLGKLPLFVALSLLGFTIAIAMLTVLWVRSRPRRAATQ